LEEKLERNEDVLYKAKGILRIEVSIKERKLNNLFNINVDNFSCIGENELISANVRNGLMVKDLNDNILNDYYRECMEKLFGGVKVDNMINDSIRVNERLIMYYGKRLSGTLFATWSKLSMHGYDFAKESMSKATFHRHLNLLRKAGCSWNYTDVQIVERELSNPIDFFAYMMKNLCISGESEEVSRILDNVA
jgi:II/X family phage/plasmid replication protein